MIDKIDKNNMYRNAGVNRTRFQLARDSHDRPGFFSPFKSVSEVQQQIRSPIVMPIICVESALIQALELIKNTALVALNFAMFDFEQSGKHLALGLRNLVTGIGLAFSAIIDTLSSVTSLVTRCASSIVVGVVIGMVDIKQGMTTDVDSEYSERDAQGHQSQNTAGYPVWNTGSSPTRTRLQKDTFQSEHTQNGYYPTSTSPDR